MRIRQIWNRFYHLRMMVTLAVSLTVVTLLFNLPLQFRPHPRPWPPKLSPYGTNTGIDRSVFPSHATHPTSFGSSFGSDSAIPMNGETEIEEEEVPDESEESWKFESNTIPVLDHAEIMPQMRGGLGAYYILIEYPKEAINLGIQGRLTLTFTVNQDGTTSDIIVSQPLHSLLDSAAVQALRKTRFVPGQHLGESARIRMRLPVRFELVNSVDSTNVG